MVRTTKHVPARTGRRRAVAPEATHAPEPGQALLVAVLLLVAARCIIAWIPGTWLWGVDLLRFANALWWLIALSPFVALLPGVAPRAGNGFAALGDRVARTPGLAAMVAFAAVALLLMLLPDRSRFVGDSLLRSGTLDRGQWITELF